MTKIFVSAPFLPVPGLALDNDVVFSLFERLEHAHPDFSTVFARPQIWVPSFMGRVSEKWANYARISAAPIYRFGRHDVMTLNFVTKRSIPSANALLSDTLYWANRRRLRNLLVKGNIRLLHPQMMYPDGLLAYRLHRATGIPYVLTARLETPMLDNPLARRVSLKIARHAAAVTTMNVAMHRRLAAVGVASELIPNGVDLDLFSAPQTKPLARSVKILTVARLLPIKRIDCVLRALARLAAHDFTYTVVGEGDEIVRLKALAAELGIHDRVTFTGGVPYEQVAELMKRHDLFVLTSEYEVFGRVYVEAMAAGLPIVYTKGVGFDGYLEDQGFGTAVTSGDVIELAGVIKAYLDQPDKIRAEGLSASKAAARFSWTRVVREYHALYVSALQPSRTRRNALV